MSFLGKTQTYDPTPTDVRGVRRDFGSALQGQIPGALAPIGDYSSNADSQFFLQNLLQPYTELFAAQRASGLAQAKESAGNLTGSGYNNILGASAAESIAGEQTILGNILNQLRAQEIQRGLTMRGQDMGWQGNLLNTILGFASSGWGREQMYQPGLLDSLGPMIGQVAGAYAGRAQTPRGPTAGAPGVPGYTPSVPPGTPDYRP